MGNCKNWVVFKTEMERHNDASRAALRRRNESPCSLQNNTPRMGSKSTDFGVFVTLEELHSQAFLPSDDCLALRTRIIRSLQGAIPEEERNSSGCCVIVSIEELRTVRSLSPCDYLVKSQVDMIIKSLIQCKTIMDIQHVIQGLLMSEKISNGMQLLALKPAVLSVLRQYSASFDAGNARLSMLG